MEEYVKLSLKAFEEMQDEIREKHNLQKELNFVKSGKDYRKVYYNSCYYENGAFISNQVFSDDLVVKELHSKIEMKDLKIQFLEAKLNSLPKWAKKLLQWKNK